MEANVEERKGRITPLALLELLKIFDRLRGRIRTIKGKSTGRNIQKAETVAPFPLVRVDSSGLGPNLQCVA